MSVIFDKANDNNNGDWLKADGALAPSSGEFTFSVSLWVYFEANVVGTETVWFYGDKDDPDRYLVLEARLDSGSTKLRARMNNDSGAGPTSIDSVAVSTGDWHLVTIVATKDIDSLVVLTLYLDDKAAVTGSQVVATTNENHYDRFALGRFAGLSGSLNPGSFLAEQVAIWDSQLSSNNHKKMYADNFKGENVRRPPTILSPTPDIGYWVLAGHHRHGLKVVDHTGQQARNDGDLFNESSISGQPDKPIMATSSGEPLWSCETPAVLFDDAQSPSGIPVRRRKVRPSRYNPQFFVFTKPERVPPWNADPGGSPMWADPNFVIIARVRLDSANGLTYEPPLFSTNYSFPPYITQITRRIADWFEYQGFQRGRGSEGGGDKQDSECVVHSTAV